MSFASDTFGVGCEGFDMHSILLFFKFLNFFIERGKV